MAISSKRMNLRQAEVAMTEPQLCACSINTSFSLRTP
jgi:hypothetical protein